MTYVISLILIGGVSVRVWKKIGKKLKKSFKKLKLR